MISFFIIKNNVNIFVKKEVNNQNLFLCILRHFFCVFGIKIIEMVVQEPFNFSFNFLGEFLLYSLESNNS